MIKSQEQGRTLLEVLAVMAVIGILSVSGLHLFSKSMVQIRANDITNEAYKLFSSKEEKTVAKDHRDKKHQAFYVGTENQKKTSYGYGIKMYEKNCKGKKMLVAVGQIEDEDRAIQKNECRHLFHSVENATSPIKKIYQYDTCTELTITQCENQDQISALTFEFKLQ